MCSWQDGVPETIEILRKAGINFWMLTGDKQSTAIQIALLCNFISSGTLPVVYIHILPSTTSALLLLGKHTDEESLVDYPILKELR